MTTPNNWNAKVIDEFRENEGKVGGNVEGAPLLLLHTRGAKTGKEHVNPVMYLPDNGRYVVFASKGGAPSNPGWFHNLKAHPDTKIEVGTKTVDVHATVADPEERNELYRRQAERYPQFAEYERKTDRTIPVVVLSPR